MKLHWIVGAVVCAAAFAAQAQYKYIGPDGRTVYSDQPPPPSAKVLKKEIPGAVANAAPGSDLPFALQQATRANPVVLYTSPSCGAPCNDGRSMLTQRGIPFSEKTISSPEDTAEFAKTINSKQLPVLMVGKNKLAPFSPDDWATALTSAGYPTSSQLPPGYKNPAPTRVAQNTEAAKVPAPGTPATTGDGAGPPPAGDTPSQGNTPSWFKGF